MGTVASLYRRVEALDTDLISVQALTATADNIADLNVEQMNKGIRSDDTDITPDYTDYTIFLKEMKGQPTDRVTLQDTGSFYQGIRTEITGDKVITRSTDEKNEKLMKKYGNNIFGLSSNFKSEYIREFLRPLFHSLIKTATGL